MERNFFFNFVVGGLLIATSGFLSDTHSTYFAGLLYGSLPLGAFYLYWYSLKNKNPVDFIHGSVLGGIVWVLMVAILYLNIEKPIPMIGIASFIYGLFLLSNL
jgi:hypothetical protein